MLKVNYPVLKPFIPAYKPALHQQIKSVPQADSVSFGSKTSFDNLLESPDPEKRLDGLFEIDFIFNSAQKPVAITDKIAPLMFDPDELVRLTAIRLFGKYGSYRDTKALLPLLNLKNLQQSDIPTLKEALLSVGDLGNQIYKPLITQFLKENCPVKDDHMPIFAMAALESMNKNEDPKIIRQDIKEYIVPFLNPSKGFLVNEAALEHIVNFADDSSVKAILPLIDVHYTGTDSECNSKMRNYAKAAVDALRIFDDPETTREYFIKNRELPNYSFFTQ